MARFGERHKGAIPWVGEGASLASDPDSPLQDLVEEPANDEAACLVDGDAARLQVEQLLVVEATRGRGVAGAGDLTGLDLEIRHGVGAGAVGEDQVEVELVRVGGE